MGSLPAANATITSVADGGFSEDYDATATAGTAKWTGNEDCYVVEQIRTVLAPDGLNRLKTIYLVVPADLGATVESGDTVAYLKDGTSLTGVVWEVQVAKIAGTARLHLQDARTA